VEGAEQQKHAQHEAEVANAVDDESLFAGVGSGFLEEIKADQEIAGEAHAFPSDKEQNVIGSEDQNQHEEHEEIQVAEKAVVAALVGHVAGGVDVDEETYSGDDQHTD